jgi:Ca2+-binding RTX toxin-like protein
VRRAAATAGLALAAVALAPSTASADISCAVQDAGAPGAPGNVLAISATTPELDVVAVQRSGDEIVVSNDAMVQQVSCAGGTPTVTNVDTIAFTGAPVTSFVIDLRGGQFEPGATPSPLGPEIEWSFDWTDGFLVINSLPGTDAIGLGLTAAGPAANLNRAHEDPWDAEASLGNLQSAFLRGDGGNEFLSAAGNFAPFTEFTGPLDRFAILDGGGGSDILHGGSAADLIDGGGGKDNILGGAGRDEITAGGGADTIDVRDGERDRVNCGSGRDKVREDRRDKLKNC